MNYLVLNLPYSEKIIRRYSCSYFAKGFLFPPQELLRVATIIDENKLDDDNLYFIDAIAGKISKADIVDYIKERKIDIVISMLGIEFSHEDAIFLSELKVLTDVKTVGIGYINSKNEELFTDIDLNLDNNFEEYFFQTFRSLKKNPKLNFIKALKNSKNKELIFNPNRIKFVNRNISKRYEKKYSNLFTKGKTAFLYLSFGCPFNCTYCIKSYDLNNSVSRNIDDILLELDYLHENKYENIRLLDDNCTLKDDYLIKISDHLIKNNMKFNFYGLSRIDLLSKNRINLLKKLNFKQLYLGLETLSPKLQKEYNKNIDISISKLKTTIIQLKEAKIESGFWMLYNPLFESIKSVKLMAKKLRKINPTFVNISELKAYPDTLYYNKYLNKINMSIRPFYSKYEFKNKARKIELAFLITYNLGSKQIIKFMINFVKYPIQMIILLFNILKFNKVKLRDDII